MQSICIHIYIYRLGMYCFVYLNSFNLTKVDFRPYASKNFEKFCENRILAYICTFILVDRM